MLFEIKYRGIFGHISIYPMCQTPVNMRAVIHTHHRREEADGGFDSWGSASATIEDPFQNTNILPKTRPDEAA